MPNRAQDWLAQAKHNLDHARLSAERDQHDWACFAAHQCAEMALKAAAAAFGGKAWGHTLTDLLADLRDRVDVLPEMIEQARVLDNYYIPTRYPDSHPSGPPAEHYGPLHSRQAVEYADHFLQFARRLVAEAG